MYCSLGFDLGDVLYDTGDAWMDLRNEFTKRATFRMTEQLMSSNDILNVLRDHLHLKLTHFTHLQGAPSQIVSQIMVQSHTEGYDYFYQVNDDTSITTSNWATMFISTLESNELVPNLGITGPTDSNNEKIFTHSFVHRTHIDVSIEYLLLLLYMNYNICLYLFYMYNI